MFKKYLINGLILLPFIWLSTGLLILRNGDKTMVAMVIISLITTLLVYGLTTLKTNISTNKLLWLLCVICGYFLFSYYYHGLSSREIRSFIAATLLVAIFPSSLLTKKFIVWLTVISALISFYFAYYCMIYMHWSRGAWPINAIPYGTLIAGISVIALSLSLTLTNYTEKAVTFLAFILSSYGLIITESRGVWLGFIFALAVIFVVFITTKKIKITWRSVVIAIILIGGVSIISKPLISQRLSQTHQEYSDIKSGDLNTSIGLRLQMWQSAPMLIEHHELLGQGNQYLTSLDNLYHQGRISKSLYEAQPPHFHNQYVDYMVKKGIVGLILLLCLLILPLRLLKNASTLQRYITISLVSLFAVASLTDVPLNHGQTIFMYIFWLGCFTTTSNNEHADND
ncbi:O-antigen ligase family protein [Photobacterium carnosum]|uniref:O-antigen ligase family protein n=1 Tax=Photobacterium carnosum TaxID=2023717 RepID=UPI001C9212B3|nr:O-antigen ligase family protein [Photobacterium carnosum]MBY3788303.1 O-antigen ligase family protein [Photobacterium carnosum]